MELSKKKSYVHARSGKPAIILTESCGDLNFPVVVLIQTNTKGVVKAVQYNKEGTRFIIPQGEVYEDPLKKVKKRQSNPLDIIVFQTPYYINEFKYGQASADHVYNGVGEHIHSFGEDHSQKDYKVFYSADEIVDVPKKDAGDLQTFVKSWFKKRGK